MTDFEERRHVASLQRLIARCEGSEPPLVFSADAEAMAWLIGQYLKIKPEAEATFHARMDRDDVARRLQMVLFRCEQVLTAATSEMRKRKPQNPALVEELLAMRALLDEFED